MADDYKDCPGLKIPPPFVYMLALLVMMNLRVIRREELHLEQVFGDAYHEYKSRVRRWL